MQQKSMSFRKHGMANGDFLLSILEYFWIIALIMNGNSVYNAAVNRDFHLMLICVVLTYVLLFAYLIFGGMKLIRQRVSFAVMLCLYAALYLTVRLHQMSAMNYTLQFIMGLPALYLLFSMLHRRKKLIRLLYRLENVILIFCIMSLIFWVFGTWLGMLKPNMSIQIEWGRKRTVSGYWGLHFNIQHDENLGSIFYRNTGIFTESPMLNLWTDIALAIELFLRRRISKAKVVILCIVIGTATSTTGILFVIICIGLKLLLSYKNGNASMRLALIGGALLIIPAAIAVVVMVMQMKVNTLSYVQRMTDYFDAIDLWVKYPLFGGGYASISSMLAHLKNSHVGFSNTIIAVLSTGGLWNAILFYIPHILCMLPKFTKDANISCFCVCLFFLFVTVSYSGRYLAVVLIAIEMAFLVEKPAVERRQGGSIRLEAAHLAGRG